jgi:hypothetical protein
MRSRTRQRPILGDTLADEIVAKIDYDFADLDVPRYVVCQQALRAKMLDDRVRDFTSAHTDAVVVDLGAGLSTAGVQRSLMMLSATSVHGSQERMRQLLRNLRIIVDVRNRVRR